MMEILSVIYIGFFIIVPTLLIVQVVYLTVPAIKKLTRYDIRDCIIGLSIIVGFLGLCYLVGSFV